MRDPATGNVITFNGEIYNFRDLRDELTEPDEPWRSHSDTEVILRAYRRWGLDCLTRLRGMYAFALWDAASRKLFLVRDPFGIKPLYLARRGATVGFASEIRAILAMGIVDGRIDPVRVAEFLRWQSMVGQGTIVEGVECVEAGGVVEVREDGGLRMVDCGSRIEEGGGRRSAGGGRERPDAGAGSGSGGADDLSGWFADRSTRPSLSPRVRSGSGAGSLRDEFADGGSPDAGGGAGFELEAEHRNVRPLALAWIREAFDEAVRLHLESDVPVGAFLSGGLDSSAIVGTLAHLGVRPDTFTVCWDGGDDESVAARRAAELAGAVHHEVRLSEDEVLALVPRALERMDSPSADGVNSYVVSWAVRREGLKVALSGLGGDELFGGYPSFARVASGWARLLGAFPGGVRRALISGRWSAGGGRWSADRGFSTRMGKIADLLSGEGTLTDVYLEGRALFSVAQVERLLGPWGSDAWGSDVLVRKRLASPRGAGEGWGHGADGGPGVRGGAGFDLEAEHRNVRPPWADHPARERLLRLERALPRGTFVSHAEMMTYMHDTLLRDTDQMSMAHGLEVRVPFLDTVFARGVLELPDALKFGPRGAGRGAPGGGGPPSASTTRRERSVTSRIPKRANSSSTPTGPTPTGPTPTA